MIRPHKMSCSELFKHVWPYKLTHLLPTTAAAFKANTLPVPKAAYIFAWLFKIFFSQTEIIVILCRIVRHDFLCVFDTSICFSIENVSDSMPDTQV